MRKGACRNKYKRIKRFYSSHTVYVAVCLLPLVPRLDYHSMKTYG